MVDIRKNLTVRNQLVQVVTEHPRACLNGMGRNPAISNQGTARPPRTQPLESRPGRSVDQSRISSQTVSRRSDTSATAIPASTTGQSTSAVPTEGVEPNSVLLWNRSDPSGWGQYKTDMSAKLNMITLRCREMQGR